MSVHEDLATLREWVPEFPPYDAEFIAALDRVEELLWKIQNQSVDNLELINNAIVIFNPALGADTPADSPLADLATVEEALPGADLEAQRALKLVEAEIDRLRRIEARYRTVTGALERGNIRQARIWCGLPVESE